MFDGSVTDGVGRVPAVGGARPEIGTGTARPGTATGPVRGSVDAVVAAVAELRAYVGDGTGCAADERARILRELQRVDGLLATVRSGLLLAARDAADWTDTGVRSFEAARGAATRAGAAAAAREVRQAEALRAMPGLATAVGEGEVPLAHVDVLARATASAPPQVTAALTSQAGQEELVALAREQDAPEFARTVARLVATHDPAALQRDHEAQRRNRFLTLTDTAEGTLLRGRVDLESGHRLRLALEATGDRPGPDRDVLQARADALLTLAETVLALPETGSGAAVRPHVSLLMREETVAALRAAWNSGDPLPATGTEPATREDGTPVPTSEVARVLCDCTITRIVVDAADQPLNLGRSQRLYTGVQRRAIIARDRTCAFPRCNAHARYSEIHHMRWWDRDFGPTSVVNGVLLCVYHHHQVHLYDLSIERIGPPLLPTRRGRPSARAPDGNASARPGGGAHVGRVTYVFRRPDGSVVAPAA